MLLQAPVCIKNIHIVVNIAAYNFVIRFFNGPPQHFIDGIERDIHKFHILLRYIPYHSKPASELARNVFTTFDQCFDHNNSIVTTLFQRCVQAGYRHVIFVF